MRDIADVIDRIIAELPPSLENPLGGLRIKLAYQKDRVAYVAPEAADFLWEKLVRLLDGDLGPPDTPWKQRISDIMRGKEEAAVEPTRDANDLSLLADADKWREEIEGPVLKGTRVKIKDDAPHLAAGKIGIVVEIRGAMRILESTDGSGETFHIYIQNENEYEVLP